MEEINSGLFFFRIFGGILIIRVKLVDVEVKCLVYISFMVILVLENFFEEKFKFICSRV